MKLFFDTEFTGLHQNTTLISLGIVSEDNKKFYAEFIDYDSSQVDEWIQNNVISKLKFKNRISYLEMKDDIELCDTKETIKFYLVYWLSKFQNIEMWSDCLSYDWVLFNNLFGHAFNLPKNIYYIPFDICTLFKIKDIDPDINREDFAFGKDSPYSLHKHNSLHDAIIIKSCYEKLINM